MRYHFLITLLTIMGCDLSAQDMAWQWSKVAAYLPNGGGARSADINTDKAGNIYVTSRYQGKQIYPGGITLESKARESNLIIKYNEKGKVLWVRDAGLLSSMQVDTSGNVVFAATDTWQYPSTEKVKQYQIFLTKIDSNGNAVWKKTFMFEKPIQIGDLYIQPNGQLQLVTQHLFKIKTPNSSPQKPGDSTFQRDFMLTNYTNEGVQVKTKKLFTTFDHVASNYLTRFDGNFVFFIGCQWGDFDLFKLNDQTINFYLAKFDLNAKMVWATGFLLRSDNGSGVVDSRMDLTTDYAGNIYFTGALTGPAIFDEVEINRKGLTDGFAVKYNGDGKAQWAKQIGDLSNGGYGGARANGIAVDDFGNVYVTGGYYDRLTLGDIVFTGRGHKAPSDNGKYFTKTDTYIVCYNHEGKIMWAKDAGGVDNDQGNKVRITPKGQIVVLGGMFNETVSFDNHSVSAFDEGVFIATLANPFLNKSGNNSSPAKNQADRQGDGSLPKIWAVVIGISNYANKNIEQLHYAAEDARLYYNFLRSPNGGGVPDTQIKLLTNADATRNNIMKAMTNVFRQAFEDDLIILYISCHGQPNTSGDQMYFLSYDTDPEYLEGAGISQNDIQMSVKRSQANKKMIIADACHSGGLGTIGGATKKGIKDDASMIHILMNKMLSSQAGLAILSASSSTESSLESPKLAHGVFTYHLVDGLKGKADQNNDKIVSVRELYEHVYRNVVKDSNGDQHPESKGEFDNNLPLSIR